MRGRWYLAAFVVSFMLAACHRSGTSAQVNSPMNSIPLRTVCIGRLLIDLPQKGVYSWSQELAASEVTRLGAVRSSQDLDHIAAKKKEELEKSPHDTEKHLLTEYKKFDDRRYALLYRTADVDVYTYKVDRLFLIGDHGYEFVQGIATSERRPLNETVEVFSRLIPINNLSPPSSPGFCIDGAMVTGSVGQIAASIVVEAMGWKGVALTVGTIEANDAPGPGQPPVTTLYDDLKDAEDENERMKGPALGDVKTFKILLKADRVAAGVPGRETAYRVTFNNGRFKYRYHWEDAGKNPGTPTHPGISIGLDFDDEGPNENPNIPPPTEDQMLALFNAVLDSVRLRPDGT